MEMSPNTVSSASSPWSLWSLLFLAAVARTTSFPPTSGAPLPVNTTLLFDSGAPSNHLRNCSCPSPVRDCDEALANSLCRCHAVLRSSLPPLGLREPGPLTVWVKELWVMQELLNGSTVAHLQLSFCGIKPIDSEYLVLVGLRTLRIHSAAPDAPHPHQEITIDPAAGLAAELETLSFDVSSSAHVTFLDVAVLNGFSTLKSYTVVGPSGHALSQHFPHLTSPFALASSASPDEPTEPSGPAAEPLENLLVTFVY